MLSDDSIRFGLVESKWCVKVKHSKEFHLIVIRMGKEELRGPKTAQDKLSLGIQEIK